MRLFIWIILFIISWMGYIFERPNHLTLCQGVKLKDTVLKLVKTWTKPRANIDIYWKIFFQIYKWTFSYGHKRVLPMH